MSKRRFNLGDIIRKLNEDQTKIPDVKPEETTQKNVSPKERSETAPVLHYPSLPEQPKFNSSDELHENKDKRAFQAEPKVIPIPQTTVPVAPVKAQSVPPPMPPSMSPEEEEDEPFDYLRYIGIILRRKYIVIAAIIIAFVYALVNYLKADRFYVAHARLLFRPEQTSVIGEGQAYPFYRDREKLFNTHLELLRSNSVLGLVAENLDNKIKPGQIGAGLTIAQGQTNNSKNDIIELSLRFHDPELARDALNELCRSYIDFRRNINAQEITRLVFDLEKQINKLQSELNQKESDLRVFKETNSMVGISDATNRTVGRLSGMESALEQTQIVMVEMEQKIEGIHSQISKQEKEVVQSFTYSDPYLAKLADLEFQLNTVTAEYSPEHFKVKMIKQQIDKIKQVASDSLIKEASSKTFVKNPIRQALLQQLINLTIEKSALEAKKTAQIKLIEQLTLEIGTLPALEQKYVYLQRETESILQALRMLKTKNEEAKIKRDSQESEIKILELAQTPRTAFSNVKKNSIYTSILIGLIIGIVIAILLEFLDQSIKAPRDIERTLELPLLGIVPFIEADKALVDNKEINLTKNILEPFRALRANLKHIAAAHNLKTFIICSAVKGEGKTTLAANLAITFAMDGKKVILIDGDLRRSQMHHLFNIPKEIGFSDYLLGSKTVDDIIKPTIYTNLSVITSGERPHNPAELLGTFRLDTMIQELRELADVVLFDSPALLPVSDTITMAPKMDGCIMVARTLWTPMKAAKQALNQLQRINCTMFGGILNGVSHSRGYYPYYYGYYGYYSYKYSYDEDRKKPFNLREFGLEFESKGKEYLKNLRYSYPRYITAFSVFFSSLMRKKLFLSLVITLILLLLANFIFRQIPGKQQDTNGIQYIGITGNQTSGTSTLIPGQEYPLKDIIDTLSQNNDSLNRSDTIKTQTDTVSKAAPGYFNY